MDEDRRSVLTRWSRRALVLLALLVCCGAVTAGASSVAATHRPGAAGYGIAIQAIFDRAGNPVLVANFTPDGSLAIPRWSICRPDAHGVCSAAASKHRVARAGARTCRNAFRGHGGLRRPEVFGRRDLAGQGARDQRAGIGGRRA